MLKKNDFDSLYADVPRAQREEFQSFRRSHREKVVDANGIEWRYLDSGEGQETILLLVGGLRMADAGFNAILRLEKEFRVITPSYPPVETMAELADGLAAILHAEQIDKAHVMGGSFGGMVAQRFIHHYPYLVEKLVLSSTAIPDEEAVQSYRSTLRQLTLTPTIFAFSLARKRLFRIMNVPPEQAEFWQAYLRELFNNRLSKADLMSTFACMIDFAEKGLEKPEDWHGSVLILTAEDDVTFDTDAKNALFKVYPSAQVHVFEAAGHSPSLTHRDEYFGVVTNFLHEEFAP
jgi:pimeloyl-ACP methyl ester carboxylesterase